MAACCKSSSLFPPAILFFSKAHSVPTPAPLVFPVAVTKFCAFVTALPAFATPPVIRPSSADPMLCLPVPVGFPATTFMALPSIPAPPFTTPLTPLAAISACGAMLMAANAPATPASIFATFSPFWFR